MSQVEQAETPEETAVFPVGAARGAAVDAELVASAWPTLPAAIKAGILAMIRAASGR